MWCKQTQITRQFKDTWIRIMQQILAKFYDTDVTVKKNPNKM